MILFQLVGIREDKQLFDQRWRTQCGQKQRSRNARFFNLRQFF